MILFVTIIHLITALLLIAVVLMQDAKGGGAFGVGGGGGGSNQILSSTGAASFLVNLTRGLAIVFAATSIGLTYMTSSHSGSVVDSYVPPAATSTPAKPAQNAAGTAAPVKGAPAQNTAAPQKTAPAEKPTAPTEKKSGK